MSSAKWRTFCLSLSVLICFFSHQVELQKLQSQKEYFERSVSEMDADLRSCIEEADTTEKDEK